MKTMKRLLAGLLPTLLLLASCDGGKNGLDPEKTAGGIFSMSDVAKILSELPLENEQLLEVHDAVSASSGHGYDEEYMLTDLFEAPGAGVGDQGESTKAGGYKTPLRELFADYFARKYATKAGAADVERYINALSESDMQIYWPYSEDWDGEAMPIVTFDPGYGAESNYGYEVRIDKSGAHVVDSVLVTEQVAMERPVWVINRNDDAAFTPLDLFDGEDETKAGDKSGNDSKEYVLKMLNFKAKRQFDSWFGGASEFFIKCGAADGFKATKEEDLRKFTPTVTDFMVVVKRRQIGKKIPFSTVLLSSYTDQMENLAFMIVEDDGGTTTSWKCSATVKYNSKSYGFELEIPYKDKDDIVWRGPLSRKMLQPVLDNGVHTLEFGDVELTLGAE
jgi:hypothetical protein